MTNSPITKIGATIASIAALAVVGLLITMPFSVKKTPADKIALSYGGGIFEGNQFQRIVQPGSGLVINGFLDKWYKYPTTQRDVTITADESDEDKDYGMPDVITARTSDGVGCDVQLVATFKLNTNQIREFHETIGLKYKAWEDTGWGQMLAKNFLPPLSAAVQEQCRNYTSDDVAKNPVVLSEMQAGIAANLKATINASMGVDDIFCGPEFQVGGGTCPEFQVIVKAITLPGEVNSSLEKQVTSANGLITAQNEAKRKEEEARGERLAQEAVQGALTPEYLAKLDIEARLECAKNPSCVLVVAPQGTGVNVNTGPAAE